MGMQPITFRASDTELKIIDDVAKEIDDSRSDAIRAIVNRYKATSSGVKTFTSEERNKLKAQAANYNQKAQELEKNVDVLQQKLQKEEQRRAAEQKADEEQVANLQEQINETQKDVWDLENRLKAEKRRTDSADKGKKWAQMTSALLMIACGLMFAALVVNGQ